MTFGEDKGTLRDSLLRCGVKLGEDKMVECVVGLGRDSSQPFCRSLQPFYGSLQPFR